MKFFFTKDKFLQKVKFTISNASKAYVGEDVRYVKTTMGYVNGPLDMGGHRFKCVGYPLDQDDAISKRYLRDYLSNLITFTGVIGSASGLSFRPYKDIVATDTQTAIEQLSCNSILLSGAKLKGSLDLGNNLATSQAMPSEAVDICNKKYLDKILLDISSLVNLTGAAHMEIGLLKSGDIMSGCLEMGKNKVVSSHVPNILTDICNKSYVDSESTLKLPITGGTITGILSMGRNFIKTTREPVQAIDLCNKKYVDRTMNAFVSKDGDSVFGSIDMGSHKITSLATPIQDEHLCNKFYVDSLFAFNEIRVNGTSMLATRQLNNILNLIAGRGIELVADVDNQQVTIGVDLSVFTPASETTPGVVALEDNLNSTSAQNALTANQGRILNNLFSSVLGGMRCVGCYNAAIDAIEELSDIGSLKGIYSVGSRYPQATLVTNQDYFIVTVSGSISVLGAVYVGDRIVSSDTTWIRLPASTIQLVSSNVIFNNIYKSSKLESIKVQDALQELLATKINNPIEKTTNQILTYGVSGWEASDPPKKMLGRLGITINDSSEPLTVLSKNNKAVYATFNKVHADGTRSRLAAFGRNSSNYNDGYIASYIGNLALSVPDNKTIVCKVGSQVEMVLERESIEINSILNCQTNRIISSVEPTELNHICNKQYVDKIIKSRTVLKTGDVMTGNLEMGFNKITSNAIPRDSDDLCNKYYIDQTRVLINNLVSLSGDSMTGHLNMGNYYVKSLAPPTSPSDLCNKWYLDSIFLQITASSANVISRVSKSGDTMTGNLDMGAYLVKSTAEPTELNHICNKQYVDKAFSITASMLKISGGTMTGDLIMGANSITTSASPLVNENICNKEYVSASLAEVVLKTGALMTGSLELAKNKITSTAIPLNPQDLCNKSYCDQKINTITTSGMSAISKVSKAGDTMTGDLNLNSNEVTSVAIPILAIDICNKAYVDIADSLRLSRAGGIMTGDLNMGVFKIKSSADPVKDSDICTKHYVDVNVTELMDNCLNIDNVSKSGDNMTGALVMGYNLLKTTSEPVSDQDLCNKQYVDAKASQYVPLNGGMISGQLDLGNYKVTSTHEPVSAADLCNYKYVNKVITQSILITGGAMLGYLGLGVNKVTSSKQPVDPADLCNKSYVDNSFTLLQSAVSLSGDTMFGNLDLLNNTLKIAIMPTAPQHLCNKQYVDKSIEAADSVKRVAEKISRLGDTMQGNLDMGTNKIISTAVPTSNEDLCNKLYVDSTVAAVVVSMIQTVGLISRQRVVGSSWYKIAEFSGAIESEIKIYSDSEIVLLRMTTNGVSVQTFIQTAGLTNVIDSIDIVIPASSTVYYVYFRASITTTVQVDITTRAGFKNVQPPNVSYMNVLLNNGLMIQETPGFRMQVAQEYKVVLSLNKIYLNGVVFQGVSAADSVKVLLSGDVMTGDLNMGVNQVLSNAVPTGDIDLCNKAYVDSKKIVGNPMTVGSYLYFNGSNFIGKEFTLTTYSNMNLSPNQIPYGDFFEVGYSVVDGMNADVLAFGANASSNIVTALVMSKDAPKVFLYQGAKTESTWSVKRELCMKKSYRVIRATTDVNSAMYFTAVQYPVIDLIGKIAVLSGCVKVLNHQYICFYGNPLFYLPEDTRPALQVFSTATMSGYSENATNTSDTYYSYNTNRNVLLSLEVITGGSYMVNIQPNGNFVFGYSNMNATTVGCYPYVSRGISLYPSATLNTRFRTFYFDNISYRIG